MGKYEEALERARAGKPIDEVFPELKESEDERIRKAALEGIEYLEHKLGWDFIGDTDILDVKEYLERQKEQPMSAEEVLIRAGLKPYRDGNQWCVLAGGNIQEGICGFGDTINEALYQFLMEVLKIQKEQKPLSTEETERNSIAFLEQLGYTCIPHGAEQKPAEWSEEDELMRNACITFIKDEKFKGYERSYKCIDWLKSLRPQPQGTYKQIVHSIYEMLKDKDFTEITPDHRVSLLNDIRVKCRHADEWAGILDEPRWKPSEDQMRFLLAVINDPNNIGAESCYMNIKSLYNDLKKL